MLNGHGLTFSSKPKNRFCSVPLRDPRAKILNRRDSSHTAYCAFTSNRLRHCTTRLESSQTPDNQRNRRRAVVCACSLDGA